MCEEAISEYISRGKFRYGYVLFMFDRTDNPLSNSDQSKHDD